MLEALWQFERPCSVVGKTGNLRVYAESKGVWSLLTWILCVRSSYWTDEADGWVAAAAVRGGDRRMHDRRQ